MVWAQFIWFIVSLIVSVALAPKPPKPKPATIDDFDLPTAQLDRPLPVLFGTKRITGPNVLWYGDLRTTKIKQKSLFSSTTIGFRYYLGIHFGIGYGPVDELTKIEVGDRELWSGVATSSQTIAIDASKEDLFGGEKKEGGMLGQFAVMMGEQSQTANAYMDSVIAGPMPAFRHMFGVVWEGGTTPQGYVGNTPFLKPWAFTLKRILNGWMNDLVWYEARAAVGNGMNPAHIIYQVLTDHRFGQGTSTAQIDDVSFREAADTMFTEGLGLNLLWNQSSRIEDFLQIVLDHIGGVLALDPANNKYVLKLFRDDYDAGTLDEFGPDEISEQGMVSLQTQAWGETVNELVITYTDPDTLKSIPLVVQDLANIRNQQGVVSETIDRSGISDNALIVVVASRELAARSSPLWRARFIVNREFWNKTIGDVFKLNWPTPLLSSVVMRVMKAAPGTLEDGKIAVEALQDIYALVGLNYNVVQGAGVQTAPLPPAVAEDTNPNPLSVELTGPPSGPLDGDRYLIPTSPPATDTWAGHEGEMAEWDQGQQEWTFLTLVEGTLIYDEGTGNYYSGDGAGGFGLSSIGGGTNPEPILDSINPTIVQVGGPDFDLTLAGSQFNFWSKGIVSGQPRQTQYIDSTQLVVAVPASDIVVGGTRAIEVANALPGGGLSSQINLIVGADFAYSAVAFHSHFDGTDAATTASDESDQAATITFVGNAQIDTAQSVFGGASLLLDGGGDYVSVPDHASLDFGSGDFTIECRVRFNGDPGTAQMAFIAKWTESGNQRSWFAGLRNNELVFFHSTSGAGGIATLAEAWNPVGGVWYHIAFVREGPAMRVFVGGSQLGVDDSTVSTDTFFNAAAAAWVGAFDGAGNDYLNGWIEEARIITGTALYSGTFTPPTEPYEFHRVAFLAGFDGADAATAFTSEDRYQQVAAFSGDAQLDTAQFEFGAASARFDGSGDYITFPVLPSYDLGAGDWTLEFFVRFNGDPGTGDQQFVTKWVATGNQNSYSFALTNNNLRFAYSTTGANTILGGDQAWNPAADTWYHVAFVRASGFIYHFIDGVQLGTEGSISNTVFSSTAPFRLGIIEAPGFIQPLNGWLDEVRLTIGRGIYTGNFSPPTSEYPRS